MPRLPTPIEVKTPYSELEAALDKINGKFAEAEKGKDLHLDLFKQMYEISDDPSGSDPAKYLSPKDAETCRLITDLADDRGWPGASWFEMRANKRGLDAWTKPRNFAKTSLTKAILFPAINHCRGYVFAHTNTVPSQLVALCEGKCEGEDGEDINGVLLSERGPELDHSRGIGWGRLPDSKKIAAARAKGGAYGVSYTNVESLSLVELLLAKMPKEALKDADLSRLK